MRKSNAAIILQRTKQRVGVADVTVPIEVAGIPIFKIKALRCKYAITVETIPVRGRVCQDGILDRHGGVIVKNIAACIGPAG